MLADVMKEREKIKQQQLEAERSIYNKPYKRNTIIYFSEFHEIGGIETWIYNLGHDYDFSVVYDKADKKAGKRAAVLAMFEQKNTDFDDEDMLTETGDALFAAADELCREQIEEDCDKDFKFLK